jgi:hypothetical protein
MPGGQYDSSKTRVVPVFERLKVRTDDWVRTLLSVASIDGPPKAVPANLDLTFDPQHGLWGAQEARLEPPRSLLHWLIHNVDPTRLSAEPEEGLRRKLALRDPEVVAKALELLRTRPLTTRSWHLFEGATQPDVYIETPDAVIVIEGKRTEAGATTHTTYMPNRHQIWRHIDAAWEARGTRRVFGFFIVEGDKNAVPPVWRQVFRDCLSRDALAGSFPHRTDAEVRSLSDCFLGGTTWQQICDEFEIDRKHLLADTSSVVD